MSITRPIAWRYASNLLDKQDLELEGWLLAQRHAGESYESIARRLFMLTDQEIEVSGRTIANWINSAEEDA